MSELNINAIYPGSKELPPDTVEYWIKYTENRIDSCIPASEKEYAHGLLAAHYLYMIADSEGLANVESIKVKDKIEKKFYKRGSSKSNVSNNFDLTPYGRAYKELVEKYCAVTPGNDGKNSGYFSCG